MEPGQLEAFLRTKRPSATAVRVTKPQRVGMGASRETWAFDAEWTEGGQQHSEALILRRDTSYSVVENDLRHEYQVYAALQGTGVPCPRVFWWEDDPQWIGRPFFVTGRIDGCDANPFGLIMDPTYGAVKRKLGEAFVGLLAKLHNLDWREHGFGDFLQPVPLDQAASSQVDYWEDVLNRTELGPEPVLRGVFQWLREHLPPPPARLSVVHGDARIGNFLATPEGDIPAMLDWEMGHLGDPREDIGWALFFEQMFGGRLLDRDETIALHASLTGIPVDDEAVRFWEVFAGMKLAVIFHTGIRSFADGSSRDSTAYGFTQSVHGTAALAVKFMDVPGVPA